MNVDWLALQDQLYELSVVSLRRFASEHRSEKYYGFAFDCDAQYGQVLLCLNSDDALWRRAAKTYADKTDEWVDAELRWNPGDWEYQGFNSMNGTRFDELWRPFEQQVTEVFHNQCRLCESPTVGEVFLDSVCRVLYRMENNGVFSCLKRASGFKTYVCDHDERESESWNRLAKVRCAPIDPKFYASADIDDRDLQQADRADAVWNVVDDQRRVRVKYSQEKLRLANSTVYPPQERSDGWWLAYLFEDQSIEIHYNTRDDTYRISIEGKNDILVTDVRDLTKHIRA